MMSCSLSTLRDYLQEVSQEHTRLHQNPKESPGMKAGCCSPSAGHTQVVTQDESSPSISQPTCNLNYPVSQKHQQGVRYRTHLASR